MNRSILGCTLFSLLLMHSAVQAGPPVSGDFGDNGGTAIHPDRPVIIVNAAPSCSYARSRFLGPFHNLFPMLRYPELNSLPVRHFPIRTPNGGAILWSNFFGADDEEVDPSEVWMFKNAGEDSQGNRLFSIERTSWNPNAMAYDGSLGTFESNDYCLDIPNGSSQNVYLQVYPCHGGLNQKWRGDQVVGDGLERGKTMYSPRSGKCWDLPCNYQPKLKQWGCHSGPNQRYYFYYFRCKPAGHTAQQAHDCCSGNFHNGYCTVSNNGG